MYFADVVCWFMFFLYYFVFGGHVHRVCCVAGAPFIITDRRRRGMVPNPAGLHDVRQPWSADEASGWCYDSWCVVVVSWLL